MTRSPDQFDNVHPHDELDALLRQWHRVNVEQAAANRSALMQRLAASHPNPKLPRPSFSAALSIVVRNRFLRAAASLLLLILVIGLLVPMVHTPALAAQREVMLPDGGGLEARDERGQLIGPCALSHTDVKINVTGPFTRVKVRQQYQNPYSGKIEAVYTFPLSNRAAVDSMSMTIGDRVVVAEMKERRQARQIYESARNQGYVASLLEQERPNIFTQSVANIEPGVDIVIEISYVEMLQSRDGECTLSFPMVVAPRYIPGSAIQSQVWLPAELQRRFGSILLGPASFERMKLDINGQAGHGQVGFNKQSLGPAPYLQRIIDAAAPIRSPAPAYRSREDIQTLFRRNPSFDFDVIYAGGTREFGQIAGDGLGHINGRWFYFDPAILGDIENATRQGGSVATGYASDTNQVPDASRITPMPVRPPTRAGHDISLNVSIDTGGPAIIDYRSDLHDIICTDGPRYRNLGNRINLALRNQKELPNRDFVLSWKTSDDRIQESTFAYIDPKPKDAQGGYFTLILAPPARVAEDSAVPRELIFVLDTSGSMQGMPIEKAKAVMSRAIDAMRPRDTFNLITFSGDTRILWDVPRPHNPANRNEAQNFLATQSGNGGTEMMSAINAALAPSKAPVPVALAPEELANLPADGREVLVRAAFNDIDAVIRKNAVMQPKLKVRENLSISLTPFSLPVEQTMSEPDLWLRGPWATVNGERVLQIASAEIAPRQSPAPLRVVMFLTDGQVGNDDAIIQAVRNNARTTRVFGFGIGDSPNRNLLDGMAQAGRGEVEYVNLQSNADEAVQRFATRIGTPVLTDIRLGFSDNLKVSDTIPAVDAVPDLFDVKPLIIHGRVQLPLAQGEDRGAGEARGIVDASKVKGTLTIKGNTGVGPYERTIELDLSPTAGAKADADPNANDHSVIATLWARAKVDELQKHPDGATQAKVTALGEQYGIMTPYTSFVAVEKARLTIAGRSVLVPVPIELPEGETWEGNFGGEHNLSKQAMIDRVRRAGIDAAFREVYDDQGADDVWYGYAATATGNTTDESTQQAMPHDRVTYRVYAQFADADDYKKFETDSNGLTDVEGQLQAVEDQMRRLIRSEGLNSPDDTRYSPDHFKQQSFLTQRADSVVRLNMITNEYNMVSAKLEGLAEPTADDIMEADRDPIVNNLNLQVTNIRGELRRLQATRHPDDPALMQMAVTLKASEDEANAKRHEVITRNLEDQAKSLSQSLERCRAATEKQEAELDEANELLKDKNSAMAEFDALAVMRDYLVEVRKARKSGTPLPPKPALAGISDFSDSPATVLNSAIKASSAPSENGVAVDVSPTGAARLPLDPEVQKQIDTVERLKRLRRVIDMRLWKFSTDLGSTSAESGVAIGLDVNPIETQVHIVLSVWDLSDTVVVDLGNAGLHIDDMSQSQKLIAGTIAASKLDDLAMLQCVRRIEPLPQ